MNGVTLEKSQIAAIFFEWERRCRQAPEDFVSIDSLTLSEYGEQAADYFCQLHGELFVNKQD